jgi:hypothetical protein
MLGIIWEEKKKKKPRMGWKQIMTMQSRKCILIRKKKKKKIKNQKSKIKNKIKKNKKIKIEYAPM